MTFLKRYKETKSPWLFLGEDLYVCAKQEPSYPLTSSGKKREKKEAVSINKRDFLFTKKSLRREEAKEGIALNVQESSSQNPLEAKVMREYANATRPYEIEAVAHIQHAKKIQLTSLLPRYEGYFCDSEHLFGMRECSFFENPKQEVCVQGRKFSLESIGCVSGFENSYENNLLFEYPPTKESSISVSQNRVQVQLKSFAMRVSDKIYAIDSCSFGYDYVNVNGSVVLRNYPHALGREPYDHPFVYSDNNICESGHGLYARLGVTLGSIQKSGVLSFPAQKTARLLRKGYSSQVGVVKIISRFEEISLDDARRRNLAVYDNDM